MVDAYAGVKEAVTNCEAETTVWMDTSAVRALALVVQVAEKAALPCWLDNFDCQKSLCLYI